MITKVHRCVCVCCANTHLFEANSIRIELDTINCMGRDSLTELSVQITLANNSMWILKDVSGISHYL